MILDSTSATKIAEYLLQIKAIQLNPANPFQWASGWHSPIYCDNRKILSYPPIRTFVRQQFVAAIRAQFPSAEMIAGVATGGIAHGALVAEAMGLPFAYVRSSSKAHGMQNMIEGDVAKNQKVVVIEDLISTGGSSLKAVKALENHGCNVLGMVAIFSYGFELSQQNFETNNCKLITLSDYNTMLEVATANDYISTEEKKSIAAWRKSPSTWSSSN